MGLEPKYEGEQVAGVKIWDKSFCDDQQPVAAAYRIKLI